VIQLGGFVDLRSEGRTRTEEDSVWPSFTDIMTVIVMIFLMALVVILIRNVDLVRQLRQTIQLEQESATQSDTLELRVATLADEVARLQLRLGETNALRDLAESKAEDRQGKMRQLLNNVMALEKIRNELTSKNNLLGSTNKTLKAELLSAEKQQSLLENVERGLRDEVAVLALEKDLLLEEKTLLVEQNASLIDRHKAETEVLQSENLGLEQQLVDLITLKSVLEKRIENLDLDKKQLEQERELLSAKSASLANKLSALTNFQLKLEKQVSDLGLLVSRLREEKNALTSENNSTTAWLGELLELKQILEKEKKILAANLSETEEKRLILETERKNFEQEISRLVQKRLTLEQEKAGLLDQTQSLEVKMTEQKNIFQAEIDLIKAERNLVIEQKDLSENQRAKLLDDLKESKQRYELTKSELDYLVSKHAKEIAEFQDQKALLIKNEEALKLLQRDYGELEMDYNRMVRPARNEVGRHRVEIRHWKDNGELFYSIREPDQKKALEVTKDNLHERLSKLKQVYPGQLYTHVIFPKGRNISQEEAYLFERAIVSQYDYYYSD